MVVHAEKNKQNHLMFGVRLLSFFRKTCGAASKCVISDLKKLMFCIW